MIVVPRFQVWQLVTIAGVAIAAGVLVSVVQDRAPRPAQDQPVPAAPSRPAASPKPSRPLASPETWTITLLGLGPARVGTRTVVLERAINAPPGLFRSDLGEAAWYRFAEPYAGLIVITRQQRVTAVRIDSRWKTKSGLGIGDPRERIVALYGDQVRRRTSARFTGELYEYVPRDEGSQPYRLFIAVPADGRVRAICAGQAADALAACDAEKLSGSAP